uniref:Cytochrome c oxidase subunit 3 n=1 Tax=Balamuthia mandrillaris TaxID=66527 RepID=A0A0K1HRL9_9EUKA|nr:cytochrome oxidase subunit 3 [Balamuthia mandrillaris]AKT94891.1 cytochrome oxidase subunit 3 [Balamuthia mandrillaris]
MFVFSTCFTWNLMNLKSLLSRFQLARKNKDYDPVVIKKLLAIRHQFFKNQQRHNFYLMPFSVWPAMIGISAFTTVCGFVMYLHSHAFGFFIFFFGFVFLVAVFILWCRDIVREAVIFRVHSNKVQQGFRYGMLLFIASEVMFFFAFFWAFFSSSLSPSIWIGGQWPPVGIPSINPLGVPLANTIILVVSGFTVTLSHALIRQNRIEESLFALFVTILLAFLFLFWQFIEYRTAQFHINDGIYGSVFYMTTGFHGFHVIVGTIWLCVCFYRLLTGHFSANRHFGFEAAIWYWHFVDIVWIFLFFFVYCWGNSVGQFLPAA